MTNSGLYLILRKLLDAKTKKAAEAYISEYVGNDYLKIAREVLGRISYHRTKSQNALYYEWIKEIAAQTHDTELRTRRYVKFHFGLPILFRKMTAQAATLRRGLTGASMDEKLELMDLFAVSSLMSTKEMTEYMEQIELHYRAQGLALSTPQEAA